jgi:nitroreductase
MRALFLKIIPSSFKEPLKLLINKLAYRFVWMFSFNGATATLYYFVFNRSFYREHRAALLGKLTFQRKLSNINESSALLRRNIHRLEKGLIMSPRRDVFAENYILETVNIYQRALNKIGFCEGEIQWAFDVLTEYFSVVKYQGRIKTAREKFYQVPTLKNHLEQDAKCIPYSHQDLIAPSIDYEQIYKLFMRRRSVRWYLERPVSKEVLEQAVRAATLAPSACNRQPFYFNYTVDPDRATDIANCAMGTVGFAENLQSLIVVVGDLSNYPAERDRHVIYIDAALSAMQLMLALETMGLSTCPINWPDVEDREQQLQDKLKLHYYERPIMLIAVGYADPQGGIPFSQKKSNTLLLKEIV